MNGFTPQQMSQMEGAKQFQEFIQNDPNHEKEISLFMINYPIGEIGYTKKR